MGTQGDWQALDKHIDQSLPKQSRLTPYLESFAIDAVDIPTEITALPFGELAKGLGKLKQKCLKTDGTTKLSAKTVDLKRLKLLWCRWQKEKADFLN